MKNRKRWIGLVLLGFLGLNVGCDALTEGTADGIRDGITSVITDFIIKSLDLTPGP